MRGASKDMPGLNPPGTVTEICCPSATWDPERDPSEMGSHSWEFHGDFHQKKGYLLGGSSHLVSGL